MTGLRTVLAPALPADEDEDIPAAAEGAAAAGFVVAFFGAACADEGLVSEN